MSHESPPQAQITNQLARIAGYLHRLTGICPLPGLTSSQVSTLAYLFINENQEVYQKDLENAFLLRRSTVSSMLGALEKKDLLQRRAVPHDARLKRLVLTSQGRQVGNAVKDAFQQMNSLMIRGLTQEEILTLSAILTKIETNLQEEPQ